MNSTPAISQSAYAWTKQLDRYGFIESRGIKLTITHLATVPRLYNLWTDGEMALPFYGKQQGIEEFMRLSDLRSLPVCP